MNKLFLSLSLILFALAVPGAASAGGHAPDRPAENQIWCGPEADCPPPTELCLIALDEDHPVPAQENCIWPDDPCPAAWAEDGSVSEECTWPDDPCVIAWTEDAPPPVECLWPGDPCVGAPSDDAPVPEKCAWPMDPCVATLAEDGSVSEECNWPGYYCDEPGLSEEGSSHGYPTPDESGPPDEGDPPDESEPPEPGECGYPGYPNEYCFFEGGSGEVEGDDPGDLVCIYDLAPPTQEKGKGHTKAQKQRARARKKAGLKRAQARKKAARKRAAAKRARLKAKRAAQARNS